MDQEAARLMREWHEAVRELPKSPSDADDALRKAAERAIQVMRMIKYAKEHRGMQVRVIDEKLHLQTLEGGSIDGYPPIKF